MAFYKNKVVWITGASSGIGEALCYKLAEQGANIVLSARRRDELERVASVCNSKGSKTLVLPLDLAKLNDPETYIGLIIQQFGRIDILINNGGVSQRGEAMKTSAELDEMFMEVNFMSGLRLTKAVLPLMLKQGSGHIVAVSSILGDYGLALHSTYAAAKHAVNGFYESLREELYGTPVKVTVISPGFIKTAVSYNAIREDGAAYAQMSPAQEKGMEPMHFATKMLRAIAAGNRFSYIGELELLSVLVHRYFPRLFYWLMRKVSKKD